MAVIDPIKLIIENYPDDKVEYMEVEIILKIKLLVLENCFRKNYILSERFSENPPKIF